MNRRADFVPKRAISWWCSVDDLTWPAPAIKDRIKRRADKFAEAKADTAINFGFHFRFDFTPYFGLLHGYLRDVAENLHERGIRFVDHYSCNLIARPPDENALNAYHTFQRHHVPLHPDPVFAQEISYAGVRFNDIREIDLLTGEPYYCATYNCELFCHNNPNFLEMHRQYLKRLLSEVPMDGIETDDMCFYGYFRTCGCRFCRERFFNEYGVKLPPLDNAEFWGDTTLSPLQWGNYANPDFRNWVQMRYKIIREHLEMVRETIGEDMPLKTCCSSSGPTRLNSLALSFEPIADVCSWVNVENCGLTPDSAQWTAFEPEAMLHKEIARSHPCGKAPVVATTYATYEDSAYLGWSINRFWGITTWLSTLWGRLITDPVSAKEDADLIKPYYQWEVENDLPYDGDDVVDVRLVYASQNKYHGYFDKNGNDYFSQVQRWSKSLLRHSIGYRYALSNELGNAEALSAEMTPIVLDSCQVLSNMELAALKQFSENGGHLIVRKPFGEKDIDGTPRTSVDWLNHPNVHIIDEMTDDPVAFCLTQGWIKPRIRVNADCVGWVFRMRVKDGKLYLHIINTDLTGTPHPTDKTIGYREILNTIEVNNMNNECVLDVDVSGLDITNATELKLYSPDFDAPIPIEIDVNGDKANIRFSTGCMRVYGVIC